MSGAPGCFTSRQSCHLPTSHNAGIHARLWLISDKLTCSRRNRNFSDELGSHEGSADGNAQPTQPGKAGSADDAGLRTSTGGGSGGQGSSRTKLGTRGQTSTSLDPAADRDGTLVSGAAAHSAGPRQAAADGLLPQVRARETAGGSVHRPSCMGQSAARVAGAGSGGTANPGGQVAEAQLAGGHQPGSEGAAAGVGVDLTPAAGKGQQTMQEMPSEVVWVPGACWWHCLHRAAVSCSQMQHLKSMREQLQTW